MRVQKQNKKMDVERIVQALGHVLRGRREIVAAYLFGSAAQGRMHKESDIDIGILLDGKYKADALYTSKVARIVNESLALKTEADVRILNNASSRFLFQVIKNGKLLMSKDERERVLFETDAISRYLDFKPFYRMYDEKRHERLCA
ncbi:MAG: nucleotidyltransferase domain-containing protein [archaeon]|nr:nucleotidyltransferase domain-containing protein [archaeon]